MKINGTGGIDVLGAYTAQMVKKKELKKDQAGGLVQADKLEISPEAKKIQLYKELLNEMPAVREDLIASLRQRIQGGSYLPDSERIAAGMIEDWISDSV